MDALYFIAIVPPEHLNQEIEEIKNYIYSKYNSKASLRSPAHITMHMPFKWKDSKEQFLHEKLQNFAMNKDKFWVKLNGFDVFKPRVIFIKVEENEPLVELQKQLLKFVKIEMRIFNGNHKENAFHPHVTVAFRDLKKKDFFPAYEEFKDREFQSSFLADHVSLLKHNGKRWEIYKNFYFK